MSIMFYISLVIFDNIVANNQTICSMWSSLENNFV